MIIEGGVIEGGGMMRDWVERASLEGGGEEGVLRGWFLTLRYC